MGIPKPVSEICEADLQALINEPVMEGQTTEYKRDINLESDKAKGEFFADVCSFANGSGGDIIFGMEAVEGRPTKLCGLMAFKPDSEVLRIRDLCQRHIDPPIYGLDAKPIKLASGSSILVVRIPKTWAGPHIVTYLHEFHFYIRHLSGKRLMLPAEIRQAFTLAGSAAALMERFRLERIGNILARALPVELSGAAHLVLHILPLVSFAQHFEVDIHGLRADPPRFMDTSYRGDLRFNYDGAMTYPESIGGTVERYVQVFRNGCIEEVNSAVLEPTNGKKCIPFCCDGTIAIGFRQLLGTAQYLGLTPPIFLAISLLGIKEYEMQRTPRHSYYGARPIEREQLLIPPIQIDSLEIDMYRVLRLALDRIWQAAGIEHSWNYDEANEWKPIQ